MYKARNETIQALLDEGLISLLKQDDWIPDVHMWKTKDLDFTYNGKSYTWTGNGRIQLKGSDPLIEKKIGNTVSDVDGFIQFMVQFP